MGGKTPCGFIESLQVAYFCKDFCFNSAISASGDRFIGMFHQFYLYQVSYNLIQYFSNKNPALVERESHQGASIYV
jgi:hypothetical protein